MFRDVQRCSSSDVGLVQLRLDSLDSSCSFPRDSGDFRFMARLCLLPKAYPFLSRPRVGRRKVKDPKSIDPLAMCRTSDGEGSKMVKV